MAAARLSQSVVGGFDDAASYDQHRPSYPPDAVRMLLEAVDVAGLDDAASLIDLAAGTGKLTELLAARPERFSILAVEPHARMRRQLALKKLHRTNVVDGLSTAIPADAGTVDAVFAAQAFHWFANRESLKEIYRVLKPQGKLALVWNAEEYNTPLSYPTSSVWATKLRDYAFELESITGDREPRFRNDAWRHVFEDQTSSTSSTAATSDGTAPLFSMPLREKKVKWHVWLDQEALWSRVRTLSHFSMLKGRPLEDARNFFDEALSDVERNPQGMIRVDGITLIVWTSKLSS